jgi:hypothetical protein
MICFAPDQQCQAPSGKAKNGTAGCEAQWAPCPVFRNEQIVQQPANLLTLGAQYNSAAEEFIKNATARQRPFLLVYASHHTHSPQFAGAPSTGSTERGAFGDSLAELDLSVGTIVQVLEQTGVVSDGTSAISSAPLMHHGNLNFPRSTAR